MPTHTIGHRVNEVTDGWATARRKREDLLAGLRLEERLQKANQPHPARAEQERRLKYDRIVEILHQVDEGSPEFSYVDAETAELLRRELAKLGPADLAAPGSGNRQDPSTAKDDTAARLASVERRLARLEEAVLHTELRARDDGLTPPA